MTRKLTFKMIGFGILTWLIPFLASFPFFSFETQEMIIDIFFFKTIMIVISALTGTVLLALMFKDIKNHYIKNAIIIGLVWLIINWVLDFIFLLPMSQMPAGQYFTEIGLRYLVVPIYSIGIGYILHKK